MNTPNLFEARRLSCLHAAMAQNYSSGHRWDHLDGKASTEAAAMLLALADENERLRARAGPAGWKLVPVDATPEMLDAASASQDRGDWIGGAYFKRAWPAMLAASPAAPAQQAAPVCPACKGSGEGGSYHVPGTEADSVDGPCHDCGGSGEPPQQAEPLTDERVSAIYRALGITFLVPGDYDRNLFTRTDDVTLKQLIRAVERAHGIKAA